MKLPRIRIPFTYITLALIGVIVFLVIVLANATGWFLLGAGILSAILFVYWFLQQFEVNKYSRDEWDEMQ